MSDYDKAARYLIKRDPAGFFRWLLGLTSVDFYCWVDARRVALPDQGDLTGDLIAACRVDAGYEALCVEVQTESAENTAGRLLYGYVPRLRSEPADSASLPLRAVVGLVLNLTGPARTTAVREVSRLAPRCRFEGEVTPRGAGRGGRGSVGGCRGEAGVALAAGVPTADAGRERTGYNGGVETRGGPASGRS